MSWFSFEYSIEHFQVGRKQRICETNNGLSTIAEQTLELAHIACEHIAQLNLSWRRWRLEVLILLKKDRELAGIHDNYS